MSTLAVEQITLEGFGREQAPLEGFGPERTLDDRITALWTGLCSHRVVECPVCGGEMAPEYAAQALPVGGRCRDCGVALS